MTWHLAPEETTSKRTDEADKVETDCTASRVILNEQMSLIVPVRDKFKVEQI